MFRYIFIYQMMFVFVIGSNYNLHGQTNILLVMQVWQRMLNYTEFRRCGFLLNLFFLGGGPTARVKIEWLGKPFACYVVGTSRL